MTLSQSMEYCRPFGLALANSDLLASSGVRLDVRETLDHTLLELLVLGIAVIPKHEFLSEQADEVPQAPPRILGRSLMIDSYNSRVRTTGACLNREAGSSQEPPAFPWGASAPRLCLSLHRQDQSGQS